MRCCITLVTFHLETRVHGTAVFSQMHILILNISHRLRDSKCVTIKLFLVAVFVPSSVSSHVNHWGCYGRLGMPSPQLAPLRA